LCAELPESRSSDLACVAHCALTGTSRSRTQSAPGLRGREPTTAVARRISVAWDGAVCRIGLNRNGVSTQFGSRLTSVVFCFPATPTIRSQGASGSLPFALMLSCATSGAAASRDGSGRPRTASTLPPASSKKSEGER
jgi:hypothetical protein